MAHYAFLDKNNIVVDVATGKDEDGFNWEDHYGLFRGQVCKRTSYNTRKGVHILGGTPFRKNYACIGFTYDESKDAFIPLQPFPSWTLNEETCWWEPPIPRPDDITKFYIWNEETQIWDLITEQK
jgi:hypothetical protein